MTSSQYEPTVESRLLFEGKILNLRVDTVRMPGGRLVTREIVEHSQAVCIVPVDGRGNVLLVRQYRKPAEVELLEAPAGGMDDGETPEEAALRELQEEIGFTAGALRHLSSSWVAPGWCTEFLHAYLATDLTPSRLAPDDDENISVVPVPSDRILGMIENGEIQDMKSIASLLLALRFMGNG
ncbi:MAG: NUDIX hydrolase [Dehalococcoidia bacterium]|nr:NUDIX hydrolase [Dehalococcoidia bacterium]